MVRGSMAVLGVGIAVAVTVGVVVAVILTMGVSVVVVVRVGMAGAIGVGVFVGVGEGSGSRIRIKSRITSRIEIGICRGGKVDVELGAADQRFLAAGAVEVIAREGKALQLGFELSEVSPQVEEGAEEHIAADAAD